MEFITINQSRSSLFLIPWNVLPEDKYSGSSLEFTLHISTVQPHSLWNMKFLNSAQGSCLLPPSVGLDLHSQCCSGGGATELRKPECV